MTSINFDQDQDSCCFSSRFRSNRRIKNSQIQQKTISLQIHSLKGSQTSKKEENSKEEKKVMNHQAQTAQKVPPKYDSTQNTASGVENVEKSAIRKLVNVKLDQIIDNYEKANNSNRQIAIEQVQSQVYRKSQNSQDNQNAVISESQIIHNYFDSSEYIRAINTHNTQIKPEQPRKIRRLFKTQKN